MKTILIILVTAAFFFISCGSGNGNENNAGMGTKSPAVGAYDNSLTKGKVIDSVICKTSNNNSYALYLPSYYSADKKFPCIYFFDSHARGALPIKNYKDIAEKYGFVLVGSNVSKNGTQWPVTNEGVNALMEDTRARINIDPKRIYTCGFSGGSRVASSVAILDGGVAGVIGCAVGFPSVENPFQNKFDYFGMVGNFDFNLSDMEMLDEALGQNGFAHQLLTFNGKHEWPPVSDFETGVLWMQVNSMKENLQVKNDTLIAILKNDYDRRIAAARTSGDLINEHEWLDGIVKVLDGLADISSYKNQLAGLISGTAYKDAVAVQTQLLQWELSQQQELAKQFAGQDEKWWAKKIAELNHNVHSAKSQKESQMNQRLLNYLGLVGYMNSNHALNIGDMSNAITYLKIFKMADPKNPDCSYLSAIYYMKNGNSKQAISALNEAASSGYSEVSQLIANPLFISLRDDAGFKNVVAKVRGNISR